MELNASCVRLPKALDLLSIATLARQLDTALRADTAVVALVGYDSDIFCSGVAVDAVLERREDVRLFADLLAALHVSHKPLLALVDGSAMGGGLGLACACDWIVATERSTFGLPELLWGLAPAIIWPVVTARMAPHVAWQWTISAHARNATEARAAGVVDDLVEDDALVQGARRATRVLARLESQALKRLRGWARESRQYTLPEAVARGAAITADLAARPIVKQRWHAYTNGDAPWSA